MNCVKKELVWYVCYGSNILEERFLTYIRGGRVSGNQNTEIGARDKSDPLDSRPFIIHHRLFFSQHAPKWNGSGVAFIDAEEDLGTVTYGKMYLITKEQFLDVLRQENSLPINYEVKLDESIIMNNKTCILFEDKYYGRILYLGSTDNYPMYSFTCALPMKDMPIVKPKGEYYSVIFNGIKQTYGFDDKTIESYLSHGYCKRD